MVGPSVFPDSREKNQVLRPRIDFSGLISSPKRLLNIDDAVNWMVPNLASHQNMIENWDRGRSKSVGPTKNTALLRIARFCRGSFLNDSSANPYKRVNI